LAAPFEKTTTLLSLISIFPSFANSAFHSTSPSGEAQKTYFPEAIKILSSFLIGLLTTELSQAPFPSLKILTPHCHEWIFCVK
jgi:hypothetical protein